ncbi:MAG TPA: ABC transporter permease [Hyphomicrobiaceae bacterium]|nr:ABC transporter permease [Hyphomicrobiaceae bacterium]
MSEDAGPLLKVLAVLVYALLLAPVAIVLVISFSADTFIVFPPSGYSLRWYERVFANQVLMQGLKLSAILALVVAGLSLLVGLPAAYAIARGLVPGAAVLKAFFLAPLLLPTLVVGLALLMALQPWRLTATLTGLALGHMVVTVPFVIRLMVTTFATLPQEVEAAAASLGATPWRVFRRVTLPLALPGLAASAFLAFLLSFDETVISLFLSGPRASTLPVELVRYVEGRTDPLVAALSVILIAGTIGVVLIVERLVGVVRVIGK